METIDKANTVQYYIANGTKPSAGKLEIGQVLKTSDPFELFTDETLWLARVGELGIIIEEVKLI